MKCNGFIQAVVLVCAIAPTTAFGGNSITLTDVSALAGIDGDNYGSPTRHSLGVVWFDANNDGLPDLFATNGFDVGNGQNLSPHLYINNGDGTFDNGDHLMPSFANLEHVGALAADYDRDGDTDLFVYTSHELFSVFTVEPNPYDGPANLLLKNMFIENGGASQAGQFVDVAAAAGLEDCPPGLPAIFGPGTTYGCYQTRSATFLDYDLDGWVDLYVAHMAMNLSANLTDPVADEIGKLANEDQLFRNMGDGTFSLVPNALQAGNATRRCALVVRSGHLNNDVWPDIYVGNTGEVEGALNDFDLHDAVLINDRQGQFHPLPGFVGDDTPAAMGIDFADLNGDLRFDTYVTDVPFHYADAKNNRGNTLYFTNAGGFADTSAIAAGVDFTLSWGTNFADFDLDGRDELFVGSGSMFFPSLVFSRPFTGVRASTPLSTMNVRGSALADFDRDDDQDLVVVNQDGGLQLFRNDSPSAQTNRLVVELDPTVTNPDAIGVRVLVLTSDGRMMMKQVKGGSSAHSQDYSRELFFGLGSEIAISVYVIWPRAEGVVQTITDTPTGRLVATEPL